MRGGWIYALPAPHHDRALAVELGLDPAFEHVDHLEIDVVIVALRDLFRAAGRNEADHVSPHHSVGGLGDAEIAVFRVAPQSAFEVFFPMMADHEALPRLGLPSRRAGSLGRGAPPRRGWSSRPS